MGSWLSSVDGILSTHKLDADVAQEEGESEGDGKPVIGLF